MLSCSATENTEIRESGSGLAFSGQFPLHGFQQRLDVARILAEIPFPDSRRTGDNGPRTIAMCLDNYRYVVCKAEDRRLPCGFNVVDVPGLNLPARQLFDRLLEPVE